MKIYQLVSDFDKYKWITLKNEDNFSIIHDFRGDRVSHKWKTIDFEFIIEDDADRHLPSGDYPNFIEPVMSEKAINIILPYINKNVEVLDINVDGIIKYSLINVITVLDCLDYDKSEIEWFSDKKAIMTINKYVFREPTIKENNLFKIKNYEKKIFITDYLKKIIEKSDLKGFKFIDVNELTGNPFKNIF